MRRVDAGQRERERERASRGRERERDRERESETEREREARERQERELQRCRRPSHPLSRPRRRRPRTDLRHGALGTNDCTPKFDTSEIIMDVQWRLPMDFQWRFPTEFHLSVVLSNGNSLFHYSVTRTCQRTFTGTFQPNLSFVISGVEYFALRDGHAQTCARRRMFGSI